MPPETRRRSTSRREDNSPIRRNDQQQQQPSLPSQPSPNHHPTNAIHSLFQKSPSSSSKHTGRSPSRPPKEREALPGNYVSQSVPVGLLASADTNYTFGTEVVHTRSDPGPKSSPTSKTFTGPPSPRDRTIPGSSPSSLSSPGDSPASGLKPKSASSQRVSVRPSLSPSRAASASASTPRKTSGNTSDGGTPIHFDMKRLLSKPAPAHSCGSSIISLPSDSEMRVASSSVGREKGYLAPRSSTPTGSGSGSDRREASMASSSGRHSSRSTSRGREPSFSTTRPSAVDQQQQQPAPPQQPQQQPAPPALSQPTSSREASASREKEPRTRNVLKRRPSGKTVKSGPSPPATPIVSTPSRKSNQFHLSLDTSRPSPRPQTAPIETSKTKVSSSSKSGAPKPNPATLTPAGAVALAYKQQEERREHLASITRDSNDREPGEPSPKPYYTVFGSTSGRVVAVGGPDDNDWDVTSEYPVDDRERYRSPKSSIRVGIGRKRSLSRKVSETWKKVQGGVKSDEPEPALPTGGYVYEGGTLRRPTLQDRRSISLPKENRKSLRLSLDECVGDGERVQDPLHTARSLPSGKRREQLWSSPCDGSPDGGYEDSGRGRVAKGGRLPKGKEGKKGKEKEEEASPSGKLWKLMKRISSGGLREKFQDSAPPPVPAIPKDLLFTPPHRTATIDQQTESSGALSRFYQSRPSMSVGRSTIVPLRTLSTSDTPTHQQQQPRSSTGHSGSKTGRPSTTTRSSSPVSSDIASSRFFHRTQSTRSSTSSYGEEIPPLPKNDKLGQYIIPPSELYRFNASSEESSSPSSRSPLVGPSVDHPLSYSVDDVRLTSLPFPKRRLGSSGRDMPSPQYSPTSPDMPAFSVTNAVNLFKSRNNSFSPEESPERSSSSSHHPPPPATRPLSEFGALSAPPRPSRSPRRPPPSSSTDLTASFSGTLGPSTTLPSFMFTGDEDLSSSSDLSDSSSPPPQNPDRNSSGAFSSASTAKARPRSGSLSSITDSQGHTTLVFREMGGSQNSRRTEKDKAELWDDLLERSARAGGTIKLGGSGLMSDNIRFSNYSEA
ncbi:hypothetical protein JAAARDRAFT_542015 [Jaapia argillacea MUCL 33604]|uniref:Uncharacterized protein n=1 Tax=Jaapia argillacea MUCL 33604 TaxID=933084 RepID=A0A067P8J1_9AGAM|nr:hypothetical protein JAAARDRAFT_542015 [Jaapia argillacea MUCL 33604]